MKRFTALIFILSQASNLAFHIARHKMPNKNISASVWEVNKNIFRSMLQKIYIGESFYLQLLIFGKLMTEEASLPEANQKVFLDAKKALRSGTKVQYYHSSLNQALAKHRNSLDFIAASNIISYLDQENLDDFFMNLRMATRKDAILLSRHYLNRPNPNLLRGFTELDSSFDWISTVDKLPIYELFAWSRQS